MVNALGYDCLFLTCIASVYIIYIMHLQEYYLYYAPVTLKLLNSQVWQALLSVRSLVLPPTEDAETWIKFASLCRKSGRISQARSTLTKLLQVCEAC